MSTKELNEYGGEILTSYGAKSGPYETYKFPRLFLKIESVKAAHGVPTSMKILKETDLSNIEVSAKLNGF